MGFVVSFFFSPQNRAWSSEETVKEENSISEKSKFGLEEGNGFSDATGFCKSPSVLTTATENK